MVNPRSIARLEARIHQRAAHCLEFEINDPRASFITITRVELSHDLSAGKIFYSVLGGKSDKSRAAHMLESAAGYIQRQVARVLELRRMPHLKWVYDETIEAAAKLDEAIHKALERDKQIHDTGAAKDDDAEPDWENEYEAFVDEVDDDDEPPVEPKPQR